MPPPSPVPGAPVWVDLMTTDADAARAFYGELFGWTALPGSDEFGGYFMFLRDGAPVAGGMPHQPGMPAYASSNTWSVYLRTVDADRTCALAAERGGKAVAPPMPIADLGVLAILEDPTGAQIGMWQPGKHPGFTTVAEPGAPCWFELFTRDHAKAAAFYRDVFGPAARTMSDTDEFRYSVLADPSGGELAGIMDATGFLPVGTAPYWSVYFSVPDADAAVVTIRALGGSVARDPENTPYGRMAEVRDSAGAAFKLLGPIT